MPFKKKWWEIVCNVIFSSFLVVAAKILPSAFLWSISKMYFTKVAFQKFEKPLLEIMVDSRRVLLTVFGSNNKHFWISVNFFLASRGCCFLQTTSKIVYVHSQSRLALTAFYTQHICLLRRKGRRANKAAAQTNQTWQEMTIRTGNFSFIYDASNACRVACPINWARHCLWAVYTTAASCEAN